MLQSSVFHNYAFVTPREFVRRFVRAKKVCATQPFLECVLSHHDVTAIAKKFGSDDPEDLARQICADPVYAADLFITPDELEECGAALEKPSE